MIIALDPWFLNGNRDSGRFEQVLTDGYSYCLTQLMGYDESQVGYSPSVSAKYLGEGAGSFFSYPLETQLELFSIPYFQSSLSLLLNGQSSVQLTATSEQNTEGGSLRPDGSYCYPRAYREAPLSEITELAESQLLPTGDDSARIIGCEDFGGVSEMQSLFYDFVSALRKQDVQVDLVAVPLNPILYDYMLQHQRYEKAIESMDFFRETAQQLSCGLAGDFDPHALGAGVVDFYDGYHYSAERVAQLLDSLGEGGRWPLHPTAL